MNMQIVRSAQLNWSIFQCGFNDGKRYKSNIYYKLSCCVQHLKFVLKWWFRKMNDLRINNMMILLNENLKKQTNKIARNKQDCVLRMKWPYTNFIHYSSFRPNTSVSLKHDSSAHRNFATTIKERNESFTKSEKERDYGYGSPFRPIDKDELGAKAIRVQDIPNGALGRPVEFESTYYY